MAYFFFFFFFCPFQAVPDLPGGPFIQKMSYLFTIEPGSRWKRIKNYTNNMC